MLYDWGLLILTGFFALIGFALNGRLKSVFSKYSKVPLLTGLTGREVGEKMLREHGVYDVKITCIEGSLTDHYNPLTKTVNLSPSVYNGSNISAAAVAAHECGHAVQHAESYAPLRLRSALVPAVNFGTKAMNFVFIGMIVLAFSYNIWQQALVVIIIGQALISLFSIVTLPVEFDASQRALLWLNRSNITDYEGQQKAAKALKWAASTYVVAAIAAITTLLYYVLRYTSD